MNGGIVDAKSARFADFNNFLSTIYNFEFSLPAEGWVFINNRLLKIESCSKNK